jgi:hypothetical protein
VRSRSASPRPSACQTRSCPWPCTPRSESLFHVRRRAAEIPTTCCSAAAIKVGSCGSSRPRCSTGARVRRPARGGDCRGRHTAAGKRTRTLHHQIRLADAP